MYTKLVQLGFTDAILTYSIDKTAEVMHREIQSNANLAVAVLTEIQDDSAPYPVTKENYEVKLNDWVQRHAHQLHHERVQDFIAPFKAIISLMFD